MPTPKAGLNGAHVHDLRMSGNPHRPAVHCSTSMRSRIHVESGRQRDKEPARRREELGWLQSPRSGMSDVSSQRGPKSSMMKSAVSSSEVPQRLVPRSGNISPGFTWQRHGTAKRPQDRSISCSVNSHNASSQEVCNLFWDAQSNSVEISGDTSGRAWWSSEWGDVHPRKPPSD